METKQEKLTTLDKTQKLFFLLCLEQYDEFEGGQPTITQQLKLIDFIKEFEVLDQTKLFDTKGNVVDKAKSFGLWWRQNFDEIYKILFKY